MFESLTKEVIREALQKAVEDVGIEVAMKALSNFPTTDTERLEVIDE